MSKVARSARVGSRQRIEVINDDKTLTQAESGETYFVRDDINEYNRAIQVTLPTPETGSYFKFIMTDGDAGLELTGSSTYRVLGHAKQLMGSGSVGGRNRVVVPPGTETATASTTVFQLPLSASVGSWVECVSDGQTWFVHAEVSGVLPVFRGAND